MLVSQRAVHGLLDWNRWSSSMMLELSWMTLAQWVRIRVNSGTEGTAYGFEWVVTSAVVHIYHRLGLIRRGGDDNGFGSTLQVGPGLLYSSVHVVDSTGCLSPVSLHVLLMGSPSWNMEMAFPVMTGFFSLWAMTVLWNLAVVGIIQEHVNHVVEVNEWSLINGSLTS